MSYEIPIRTVDSMPLKTGLITVHVLYLSFDAVAISFQLVTCNLLGNYKPVKMHIKEKTAAIWKERSRRQN